MAASGEPCQTSLSVKEGSFYLNNEKIVLLSGAMHYFRVHPDYWRDRMLKMKACGLNCLETYVPWNLHEEIRGTFKFNGWLDIRKYIQLAHELGFYVILRPGPYICAEWDFGGLPSWLLSDGDMKVRSSYQPYLDAVDQYFNRLLPLCQDLQFSKGGPIIAVQLENEYGSYGDDLAYKEFLKQLMKKHKITELYVTSDNGTGIHCGNIEDAVTTLNFQEQEHGYLMYEFVKNIKRKPDLPLMVMEFWSGWFDHWGEKHHVWPIEEYEKVLTWILKQGGSVNFYMYHGGTNFGFMNGANEGLGATNEGATEPYAADVTSYDYDCILAENGDITPKFKRTKEIFQNEASAYVSSDLPEVPPNIPRTTYNDLQLKGHLEFNDILSQIQVKHDGAENEVSCIKSEHILTMEQLPINNNGGQSFGYILYRTKINKGSYLKFTGHIKDRAQVFLNQKSVGILNCHGGENQELKISLGTDEAQLDILVENMGRVNYAEFKSPILNQQRKGLNKAVLLDGERITTWQIYPLEFKPDMIQRLIGCDKWINADWSGKTIPGLFKFTLDIADRPMDTYINMKDWQKGVVFVNGFNLGRYWNIGPQQALYLPAPLLNRGENEILVYEHEGDRAPDQLTFCSEPLLGETVIHKTEIPKSMQLTLFALKNVTKLGSWVWNIIRLFVK